MMPSPFSDSEFEAVLMQTVVQGVLLRAKVPKRKALDIIFPLLVASVPVVERQFSYQGSSMQRGFSGLLFPRGDFFYFPVISSLRAVNFGSGRNNRRIKSRKQATAMAALVAGLCLGAFAAHAQDSTWSGGGSALAPFGNIWNDRLNWAQQVIPGATGTATFDAVTNRSIATFGTVSVGTLQFNAPNYTFNAPDSMTINVNGINASLANAPTFNVIGFGEHSTPAIVFNNSSSAGTAQIILGQIVDTNQGFNAGFILFNGNSTADHATITVRDDSSTTFNNSSTADHATLIVDNGGFVGFADASSGDQATIINNAGGEVKIADLTTDGTSFGSIAGAGTFNLGSKQLTVGSNNDSTTVSGVIEDHFPGEVGGVGGSLVKVGTGTLTLLGNNTYSGGTTIQDGTLAVGTLIAADQPISTALGTGNVFVDPGTLRTTSASTGVPLIINVGGNYTQAPGGTLALGIGGLQGEQFDHVQVGGNANLSGNLIVSSLNGFHPSAGNAFEVLHTNGTVSGNFSVLNDSAFNTTPGVITGHLELRPIEIVARNAVVLVYVAVPPTEEIPQPPPGGTEQPPVVDDPGITLPPVNPEEPLPESEVIQLVDPTVEELTSLYQIGFAAEDMQRFNLGDRMFQIQQSVVPTPEPVPPPISPGKEIEGKGVEGKAPPPAPPPSPINRWGVWASSWGDFVNLDSTSAAQGYRFTTFGISAGVDYLVIPNHFAVGLFGGYSHSWINLTPSGSANANTGRGGLYATYFNQGWWVNLAGWAGGTNYSTSRQALAGTANGETSGWEASTFGDAGYDFHYGDLSFGPTVSMQYTSVHLNGFGENGSLVPLQIHSDSQDSLVTDVGGRAYYRFHVGSIPVIPTVRLAWEHEYFYSNLPITASAPALGGATATFSGPALGHDSLIINANISVQWTPRISTTIGYDGQVARDNYNSNAVTGTFSFSF
jgi:autotransporter-associated beta strand protein